MANIFTVLIAESADIYNAYQLEEKIRAALTANPSIATLLAEKDDIQAEWTLDQKIYAAFAALMPTPSPTPGPLKALCLGLDHEKELRAAASTLPNFDGHILQWLITNFATILADIEALIALFHPKPTP